MFKDTIRFEKSEKRETWRLLSATDFNSLMNPCLVICWLLGFFPYEYEQSTYRFSRTRFVFYTFTMISYTILLLNMIYDINFTNLITDGVPGVIDANTFAFLEGSVVLVMYLLTNARLSVLRDLSKTSSILSPNDFNRLAKFIHTKDVVGFLYLMSHVPKCFNSNVHLTMKNFCSLYITLVNFITDMFYMNCVWILKACFKKLDECLRRSKPPINSDDSWPQTFVHRGQKDPLSMMKLKSFGEKHLEISDLVDLVNNTFFVRNIIVTASTFTIVTFNLYFRILYSHSTLPVNKNFWYIQYLGPALFYFTKFSVVIWACETATRQAKEIKTTVHDVFSGTTDPVMKREVELFSLQVLLRNNKFTAKAIEMNALLLLKMMEGIVMYIMILFQFLLTFILCNTSERNS